MLSRSVSSLVLLFVLLCAAGCAALGLGAPRSRVIPIGVKEDPDYGRCASSGYEIDLPPHATVAFVASTCVRPFRHPMDTLPDAAHGIVPDASANAAAIGADQVPGLRVGDAGAIP